MACLTLSELMSPLLARLAIRAALLYPDDLQAILDLFTVLHSESSAKNEESQNKDNENPLELAGWIDPS